MIIGSIKEHITSETRTAITPSVVTKLTSAGFNICIEKDIGNKAGYTNNQYEQAGAEIISSPLKIYKKSDIIFQINPPQIDMINSLNHNQILIADFHNFDITTIFSNVQIIRLEKVPRISKSQHIDILSSQSTVRGYTSAMYALFNSPRIASQLITASSSIKASSALIIGAGITGLQAATIFKRQGCRVYIMDNNEEKHELVKSVSADFILSPSKEHLLSILQDKNFIITTAVSADGTSTTIINEETLSLLKNYPIIVDTTPNNIAIKANTKKSNYHFYRNIYAERLAPITASELWANNMANLINTIKTSENTINLDIDYIKPMIYSKSTI